MFEEIKHWYLRNFKTIYHKPVSRNRIVTGITDSHYELGAVVSKYGTSVLRPNSDWNDPAILVEENQSSPILESMSCASQGANHVIETIGMVMYSQPWRKSSRYIAKESGTTQQGNNMTTVLDTIRKSCGMVENASWPFTPDMDWNAFYASIPVSVIEEGKKWLESYGIVYSVVQQNIGAITEALKYSPLYVCGYAWAQGQNGLYQSWGRANHCFMLLNPQFYVLDTYSPFVKRLDPSYKFGAIFSISLTKKQPMNFLQTLIKRGLQYVLLVAPTVINNIPYGAGVYNISANGVVNDTTKQDVYDAGVNALEAQKKLVGIDVADFTRLINNLQ